MGKPYSCVWFFLMLSNRFPIVTYFSISEYTATHPQGGLPSLMVRVLCYNKGCHGYKTSNHHRDIKGTVFGATKMFWLQLQFLSVLNNFKPCSKARYFLHSAEPNEPSENSPHIPVVHLSCKLYWELSRRLAQVHLKIFPERAAVGALSGQWFSSLMDLKFECSIGTGWALRKGPWQEEVVMVGVCIRGISCLGHFLSFLCLLT